MRAKNVKRRYLIHSRFEAPRPNGTNFVSFVILITVALFFLLLFVPHARAEQRAEVTFLMPAQSGLLVPSMRVVNRDSSDEVSARGSRRIIADMERVGAEKIQSGELLVFDCMVLVSGKSARCSCFMRGKQGGACEVDARDIPHDQVVGVLRSYYRGCILGGVIPAEHGRNLAR